jgi:hypothetical protein
MSALIFTGGLQAVCQESLQSGATEALVIETSSSFILGPFRQSSLMIHDFLLGFLRRSQ